MSERLIFDLDLFQALNREYESKPLVPKPPQYDEVSLEARSLNRLKQINRRVDLNGKRVLEIGCGRGETSLAIARVASEVVGVDISTYPQWEQAPGNVRLLKGDLSAGDHADLGLFDVAYSNSVWEHLIHPFAMLKRVKSLLKPDGVFVLSANLYRGPKASHRYREVFFPWPHLLFNDDVFQAFYASIGRPGKTKAWVNQLSIGDYYRYFSLVKMDIKSISFSVSIIDEEFYNRFNYVLSQFPRFDLERDFIHVTLGRGDD